jgi:hypothetical protein
MKPLPTPRQMKILYISKTDIEWESTNFHGNGIGWISLPAFGFSFFSFPRRTLVVIHKSCKAQALEFKACFERDRGAIQSELWTPAGSV